MQNNFHSDFTFPSQIKAEQAEVALEELESMATDAGKDGAKKERELQEKIRDLEDELARGGGARRGRGAVDSRGRDLQKRCAMLEADVKDLESELNAEKRTTTEMEEKLEESEKKAKIFKRENEALQADMKELLAQMESNNAEVRMVEMELLVLLVMPAMSVCRSDFDYSVQKKITDHTVTGISLPAI